MTEQEGKSKMTVLTVDEATYSDSGLYSCRNDRDVNDKDEVTVRVRHPGEPAEGTQHFTCLSMGCIPPCVLTSRRENVDPTPQLTSSVPST